MSSAFDKLARPVQKWIRQQGWRELRDIQARSIRTICETNADLIIAASTAGGKTEAAFLPLISQVLDEPFDGTGFDLLYIGPLKALITDQAMRLEGICQEAELPVVPWHGDVSQSIKTRALKSPKGILLITPESLEALFIRRGLEIGRLFGATRAIVIDELHTVLESERGVQLCSLLTRLELAIKHPIRRIGLSATLGDMDLAKAYLRPDAANAVELIEADGGEAELRLQLRGYLSGDEDVNSPSATDAIAAHLFTHLRGSDNLVFAGARQRVEIYADRLRELCEREHLPQEFYPHHASLSREHRDFVERRLKDPAKPTTAVCTSTLELGIDIGDVTCVAQIGAPFSVAALRQRLGRSGRREGQPVILRQYAVEAKLTPESSFVDRLRLGLIRSIAMIDLLLEGWCEPPKPQALHLSTLVHQILSVIAQRGGASASAVYNVLCREGPFRKVTTEIFADVLRAIGHPETGLIEQSGNGLLLLGPTGEKLVEHYSFYAVFQTPEEFRLVAEGRDLGTLPVDNVLAAGMLLIFSGRRWVVQEIHDLEKVIVVKPAKAGVPPVFGGDPGDIHDKVIGQMFAVLEGDFKPVYMDAVAHAMLEEARAHYDQLELKANNIRSLGERTWIIATRFGTVKTSTLALALRSEGLVVEQHDGFLVVEAGDETPDLQMVLARFPAGYTGDIFAGAENLITEKFHVYLSRSLLELDAVSSRLVPDLLPGMTSRILQL
ncbi:ATP-dependent helicase [Rhodovulum viride]|uniref:ATP-dependent helicase n=1 Tax=Rhodovulum viride TaxID=1231134 RepID=A0ABX9DHU8_9RHOB|nr:DEAD/DEAH box helicase [Rhodovulum viride]RAP41941.1 ATP-dependent helicase [Rhodovulum viride]